MRPLASPRPSTNGGGAWLSAPSTPVTGTASLAGNTPSSSAGKETHHHHHHPPPRYHSSPAPVSPMHVVVQSSTPSPRFQYFVDQHGSSGAPQRTTSTNSMNGSSANMANPMMLPRIASPNAMMAGGATTSSMFADVGGVGVKGPSLVMLLAFVLLMGFVGLLTVVYSIGLPRLDDVDSRPSYFSSSVLSTRMHPMKSNHALDVCEEALSSERRLRTQADERGERLSSEVEDLRRKIRELESDFRELAMASRAAQQPVVVAQPQKPAADPGAQDLSALHRLSKCRTAVEASTEAIRELRRQQAESNVRVERVQKELKEAIHDLDECESRNHASGMNRLREQREADEEPPPPPP